MNVCLIRCPSPFLIDERVFPPLGLMAVGTVLKAQGSNVIIHDGAFEDIPTGYDIYGVGPTTPEYSYALKVKDMVRRKNPKAKVMIGGPHVTLTGVNDGFDYMVLGQYANYPMIDRTLVDIKSYRYFIDGKLATTMVTSEGCPYRCAFCCRLSNSVRLKDADSVILEINKLHKDFGYEALMFFDDIFILNKKRSERIFQCLKELKMVWRCFVRADLIVKHGKQFVKKMADSGCKEVGVGIESGSDEILEIINKGEDVNTIKQGIRMLKEERIRVKGFFILGLPSETKDTLNQTDQFLEEMKLDNMDIRIYQPYPGTIIWDAREYYDTQWGEMDFSEMFYKGRKGEYYGNISTSSLTNSDIVNAWINLEAKYKYA